MSRIREDPVDRLSDWLERRTGLRRSSLLGVNVGFAYGLVARLTFAAGSHHPVLAVAFSVMSLAFLIVVPCVLGVLTVRGHTAPSWPYRIFAPWLPVVLLVLAALTFGWEGWICAVMALPILLILASLGGAMTAAE